MTQVCSVMTRCGALGGERSGGAAGLQRRHPEGGQYICMIVYTRALFSTRAVPAAPAEHLWSLSHVSAKQVQGTQEQVSDMSPARTGRALPCRQVL